MIIKKCNEAGKIVITATQMLDSMIRNSLPTRAEVKNLWNGVTSATAAAQTFTGASSAISASFTGTAGTATADYTPAVTASGSFTGTKATITVS